MPPVSDSTGYSAKVRLWLECAGQAIPLAQAAPDWVIPVEPRELPPGDGELVMEIDDRAHRRPVFLPDGMSPASEQVAIQPQASVA